MGEKALQWKVFCYLVHQKDLLHENIAVPLKGKILGTNGLKEGNRSQWFEIENAPYQIKDGPLTLWLMTGIFSQGNR